MADPLDMTIRPPKMSNDRIMGSNQNFFRSFIKHKRSFRNSINFTCFSLLFSVDEHQNGFSMSFRVKR